MKSPRDPDTMVRSHQRDDCGVCAIANRCDITWMAARRRIFGDRYKRRFGTSTRGLKQAMFVHKSWRLIRVHSWYDIPNNSIVKVIPSACEGTRNWHWVVWRDGFVWDSIRDLPLTAERYDHRLVSYIGRKP